MSYKISAAILTLEIKKGTVVMPLIEEKTGFSFALVRTNVALVA
jgi:hypothetical protein